jgi:outer membrane protein assembly factor BamB
MEEDAPINAIFQHRKYMLTVSGNGEHVRKWQATDGQLLWDTSFSGAHTGGDAEETPYGALIDGNAFVTVSPTEGELLVLLDGVVHVVSVTDGTELWSYSQSDKSGNIVHASFSEDGNEVNVMSVYTLNGMDHAGAAQLDVETGDVSNFEATLVEDSIGSIAVCQVPQEGRYSEPVLVMMNEGGTSVFLTSTSGHASVPVSDVFAQGASGVTTVSTLYISGEEAAPASSVQFQTGDGSRFVVRCEDGLGLSQVALDGALSGNNLLAMTKPLPSESSIAVMVSSDEKNGAVVVNTSPTGATNNDESPFKALQLQLEWDFLAHGSVEKVFAYVLDRKDGTFALRLLLISEVPQSTLMQPHSLHNTGSLYQAPCLCNYYTQYVKHTIVVSLCLCIPHIKFKLFKMPIPQDDAVTCMQTSADFGALRSMWVREEALARVEHVDAIDWSGEKDVLARIPSLPERLAMQVQGLQETVEDMVKFMSPLAQQLEGETVVSKDNIMFGFSKLILCLAENGKLFALDSSDGHLVWSRYSRKNNLEDSESVRVMITREKPFQDRAPEIAVVSRAGTSGMTITWLNAYTGETNNEVKFDGDVLSVAMLDEQFRDDTHRKLIGVTDAATKQFHILPQGSVSVDDMAVIKAGLKDKFFFHAMDKTTQTFKVNLVYTCLLGLFNSSFSMQSQNSINSEHRDMSCRAKLLVMLLSERWKCGP